MDPSPDDLAQQFTNPALQQPTNEHDRGDLFAIAPPFWDRIRQIVRQRIGSHNYSRWFANTSAELTNDGRLIVRVPNPIHQVWIESNYSQPLREAIITALGGARVVEFQVGDEVPATVPFVSGKEPTLKAARQLRPHAEPQTEAPLVVSESRQSTRSFSEAGLNPKFSFDNFVVGPNSSYSVAVAQAVAEKPGRTYNPLFLHGATGLGKTHLMQAIGQELLLRKRRCVVRYVTSEQFTNEFVEAIKRQSFSQFRQKYRKVDVLLIDDVHFFADKDSTQEEFFHTFNELFNNAKQIVLASDRAPSEIKNLESRLVSRFQWGLATQIQTPDFETRVAILRRKQSDFNVNLEPWIIEFMAQKIRANVRKLEGALTRVAAHVSLEGSLEDEKKLEHLLSDVLDGEPTKSITVDRIQRTVAAHFDLRVSDLTGPRRPKNIAEARQVAMFLTRQMTRLPLMQIGEEFGGRDHGTVIHACKVISSRVTGSDDWRRVMDSLTARILED